jgi:DNA-binding winged helix-turn-helix (wHTH) protein
MTRGDAPAQKGRAPMSTHIGENGGQNYETAIRRTDSVGFAGFMLDVAGHSLTGPDAADISLRRSEFDLLLAFLRAPGRVLSRDYLLDAVAGRPSAAFDRSIDVLVGRLRRKIEADPKSPTLIITVPGAGYKFTQRPRQPSPMSEQNDSRPEPRAAERRHQSWHAGRGRRSRGSAATRRPLPRMLRTGDQQCWWLRGEISE